MGIDIDAFAVETPRFVRLLDLPLWRVLRQLAKRAPCDEVLFSISERKTYYQIVPSGRLLRVNLGGQRETLELDELALVPFLQQSCGAYLRREETSSWALHFLLRDWQFVETDVIHTITEGHRRWWIGSVLSAAARVELPVAQYRQLSALLARMLAGWDCGVTLPPIENRRDLHGFPEFHRDADDDPTAVFSADECHALVDLFQLLLKRDPIFESPTPGDSDDFDWNQYAREMIGHFMKLKSLVPPCTHMITFIQ
jgi:hypothetical protein